jgi:hypothetical protein
VDKTKARLLQNYWWSNMDSTISDFIKTCVKCQKNGTDVHPKPDLLTLQPICTEPNQRIHENCFGAFGHFWRKQKIYFVYGGCMHKYVELVALPNKEAETIANAIFSHWICHFGIPVEVITDQGKEFCNKLTDELFQLMEMKHGKILKKSSRHFNFKLGDLSATFNVQLQHLISQNNSDFAILFDIRTKHSTTRIQPKSIVRKIY